METGNSRDALRQGKDKGHRTLFYDLENCPAGFLEKPKGPAVIQ